MYLNNSQRGGGGGDVLHQAEKLDFGPASQPVTQPQGRAGRGY